MEKVLYELLAYDRPGHILAHGTVDECCPPLQAAVKFLQRKPHLQEVPGLMVGVSGGNGRNPLDSCWEYRLDDLKKLL
ncbi:MAG: hypothetical protein C4524_06485 [Candidatus Zixiibacteriota bacterium]|nr:MAG: hypothetical protein C4524_06485 [candidate division Zixibacteria bacterium]